MHKIKFKINIKLLSPKFNVHQKEGKYLINKAYKYVGRTKQTVWESCQKLRMGWSLGPVESDAWGEGGSEQATNDLISIPMS